MWILYFAFFFFSVLLISFVLGTPIPDNDSSSDQDLFRRICPFNDSVACFYKKISHRRNPDGTNTKIQGPTIHRHYWANCSTALRFNQIYIPAEDQNSEACKNAMRAPWSLAHKKMRSSLNCLCKKKDYVSSYFKLQRNNVYSVFSFIIVFKIIGHIYWK